MPRIILFYGRSAEKIRWAGAWRARRVDGDAQTYLGTPMGSVPFCIFVWRVEAPHNHKTPLNTCIPDRSMSFFTKFYNIYNHTRVISAEFHSEHITGLAFSASDLSPPLLGADTPRPSVLRPQRLTSDWKCRCSCLLCCCCLENSTRLPTTDTKRFHEIRGYHYKQAFIAIRRLIIFRNRTK